MTILLKMAIRNIWRNKRRSFVIILAIASGVSAVMFLWGFSTGTIEDMRNNMIDSITSHAQISAVDFDVTRSSWQTVKNSDQIIERVKEYPHTASVTKRIVSRALLATENLSRGVLLTGVNASDEKKITHLYKKIIEGTYLTGAKKEIIIGHRLAKQIDAHTGDKIVVMAQDRYGMSMGLACTVKGIFRSGYQLMDERFAYMDIASAGEILAFEGGVSKLVVKLDDRNKIPDFFSYMRGKIDLKQNKILAWFQIAPSIEQWSSYAKGISAFMMFTVIIVVAASIMNTVLMSIMERTKEFGVLLAIGMSPGKILQLIFLETIFLELAGLLAGLCAGSCVVWYYGTYGLSLKHVATALETNFMSSVIYTVFDWEHIAGSMLILTLVTLVAAIYPAAKASRLRPVTAIYYS